MQTIFLLFLFGIKSLHSMQLIHDLMRIENLYNTNRGSFRALIEGLNKYTAGPLTRDGIWKYSTNSEILCATFLSFPELHFTALSVENCVVRTVTCYGASEEHYKLVSEELTFAEDLLEEPVLLSWTQIPVWCETLRVPCFETSKELGRALQQIMRFFELFNSKEHGSEDSLEEYLDIHIHEKIQIKDELMERFKMWRVLQSRIPWKKLAVKTTIFFRRRFPSIKILALDFIPSKDSEHMFSLWRRSEYSNAKGKKYVSEALDHFERFGSRFIFVSHQEAEKVSRGTKSLPQSELGYGAIQHPLSADLKSLECEILTIEI